MRRSVWIFLASIFLPSLGLAWLAVRSLRDQQFVLERQQSLLFQGVTDSLAKQAADSLDRANRDHLRTGLRDAGPECFMPAATAARLAARPRSNRLPSHSGFSR